MDYREGQHFQYLSVSVHPDSQDVDRQDGNAKSPETLPDPNSPPTRESSPCLENERALTDYANALGKLWQR
jgi:hypothetical protein